MAQDKNETPETKLRFIKWHGFGFMRAESFSVAVEQNLRGYMLEAVRDCIYAAFTSYDMDCRDGNDSFRVFTSSRTQVVI